MSEPLPTIDEILRQVRSAGYDYALSFMTSTRSDEIVDQAKAQLERLIVQKRLNEARGYCDDGHFHDYANDAAMLPSERIAELESKLKGGEDE